MAEGSELKKDSALAANVCQGQLGFRKDRRGWGAWNKIQLFPEFCLKAVLKLIASEVGR